MQNLRIKSQSFIRIIHRIWRIFSHLLTYSGEVRVLIHNELDHKYPGQYYEDERDFEIFSEELKSHTILLNKEKYGEN